MPTDGPPSISDPDFCYCVHPRGEPGDWCATCGGRILNDPPEGADDY